MFSTCPKCGHSPLPADQSLPAACPACGVFLAKVAQLDADKLNVPHGQGAITDSMPDSMPDVVPNHQVSGLASQLLRLPSRIDKGSFALCLVLWLAFAVWGLRLIGLDYRDGAMSTSFIHAPLLVFHEAGHVLFMPFGHWVMVLGGTLGQLLMPAILGGALLITNRDPFGASLGLWLFGVSLLDVAPYMYDALEPQLTLLSGMTGEAGGHDWIYLFNSLGLLKQAQRIGAVVHLLGALVVIVALGWGAVLLRLQYRRLRAEIL